MQESLEISPSRHKRRILTQGSVNLRRLRENENKKSYKKSAAREREAGRDRDRALTRKQRVIDGVRREGEKVAGS